MVHRPPDSRLLANLLSQDKDYHKAFTTLLDAAHASVASLSAYAAASRPPASSIILTVAESLASADEALRRYAKSVDEWRDMMKGLKTLEDEVANVLRDREILVTRVLKASKSSKPPPAPGTSQSYAYPNGNHHHNHNGGFFRSSSSLSVRSEFSGTAPGVPGTSSKLAAAQSELQACEAHLAAKERELAVRRCATVKAGLELRFTAMVQCGWAWGEIAREGLRVLEQLPASGGFGDEKDTQFSMPVTQHLTTPQHDSFLSTLDISRLSSDVSSLSPSQSASQINGITIAPPPPPIPSIPFPIPITATSLPGILNPTVTTTSSDQQHQQHPASSSASSSPAATVDGPTAQPNISHQTPPRSHSSTPSSSRSADMLTMTHAQTKTTMRIPPAHAISEVGPLPIATETTSTGMGVPAVLPSPPPSNVGSFERPTVGSGLSGQNRSISSVSVKSLPYVQGETGQEEGKDCVNPGPLEDKSYGLRKHILSRRITEEDIDQVNRSTSQVHIAPTTLREQDEEDQGGSSECESRQEHENLKVVENPRFASKGKAGGSRLSLGKSRAPGPAAVGGSELKRERKNSVFGSLRGLFSHSHSKVDQREGAGGGGGLGNLFGERSGGRRGTKWETRIDKNIRFLQKGSDSEDDRRSGRGGSVRLNSPQRRNTSVNAAERRARESGEESVPPRRVMSPGRKLKKPTYQQIQRQSQPQQKEDKVMVRKRSSSVGDVERRPTTTLATFPDAAPNGSQQVRKQEEQGQGQIIRQAKASLTRNLSTTSAQSAPPAASGPSGDVKVGRRVSLTPSVGDAKGKGMGGHTRTGSGGSGQVAKGRDTIPTTSKSVSLMSIVEGVAKGNRDAEAYLSKKENIEVASIYRPNSPAAKAATTPAGARPVATSAPIHIPRAPQSVGRKELEAMEMERKMEAERRREREEKEEREKRLELPRAPGSVFDSLAAAANSRGMPEGRVGRSAASASAGVTAASGRPASVAALGVGGAAKPRRPATSPLRSALKHSGTNSNATSRTASPAPQVIPSTGRTATGEMNRVQVKKEQESEEEKETDDSASVSSYETGHEVFIDGVESCGERGDDEVEKTQKTRGLGPTFNAKDYALTNGPQKAANGQVQSMGTTATTGMVAGSGSASVSSTGGTPQRRKSVRVSLQPTFSPSPPAIYDDDEAEVNGADRPSNRGVVSSNGKENGRAGGSGYDNVSGWMSRRRYDEVEDMWENSSEEGEEYALAKKLLSRASATDAASGGKGW